MTDPTDKKPDTIFQEPNGPIWINTGFSSREARMSAELSNMEKQAIVEEMLKHPHGSEVFSKQRQMQMLAETNERMLQEGVPAEVVAYMSANAVSRMNRPSMMEIARKAFPIDPLPVGALPIYDKDPEVASVVIPDADPED